MVKRSLLFAISTALCGMANASASGQFSSSDVSGQLVLPGGQFSLRFVVDSNPSPFSGTVTSLGFDVPIFGFAYTLNGSSVCGLPDRDSLQYIG
jgi:hypothetical protein